MIQLLRNGLGIRIALGIALAIVVADLAQVVWIGKGLAALGGAALYGLVAVGLLRDEPRVWWIALLLPVLPTTILSGLAGPTIYANAVDTGMLCVYSLQLALALLAALHLFRRSAPPTDNLS